MSNLLTIKEASRWASEYIGKNVSPSNISYLLQYGKVKKYGAGGSTSVNKSDLIAYYKQSVHERREDSWRAQLGSDLNWRLSFAELKEKDTTKHVHRLHPYKGKFIPQLVEYFVDSHTDSFKKASYFSAGDIILDPFAGSGTTLVQANELGIHALGIDVSAFNALMCNVKIARVNFQALSQEIGRISAVLKNYTATQLNQPFERELLDKLNVFNAKHFPSPSYKIRVQRGEINEGEYAPPLEHEFAKIFNRLVQKYRMEIYESEQEESESFLDKWYIKPVRREIHCVYTEIQRIADLPTKNIITLILSRTIRSCRATTHADLATLKQPVIRTYYCRKHGKICKPLFSILSWWERYCKDTVQRLKTFAALRSNTQQICLTGDARNFNIHDALARQNPEFATMLQRQKIRGIFTSPPYLGLINYHEQHAYAYDLFGFDRLDNLEIGPLFKGQGREAKKLYIQGIADVLIHSKEYLDNDYNIFIVANDKHNLYPLIAERAGMRIVEQYKRPVLNRVENDRSAYSEVIFHLREK